MKRNTPAYLVLLVALIAASGASCPTVRQQIVTPAPAAFTTPPSLPEAIRVVNASSAPIRQLQTDNATLAIQGLPALRANIAIERPRNFRLRANFVGMGQVLDMGSNSERFWALIDTPEIATNIPRAVYHARHDQYDRSRARDILPIQPQWLIDAFGLVQLDPTQAHEGPYARGQGRLEIRSRIPATDGDLTRILVLHETYGWILEQHLYDAQGQPIASAVASGHRYYPDVGASLPHHIEVHMPPPRKSFQIDVEGYTINQLYSDPAQLWAMPVYDGYPLVDLGAPQPHSPSGRPIPGHAIPTSTRGPGYPATGYRPQYRGYTSR